MRAFVAGATGYVGGEIVRILGEREIDVLAHVRPDSSSLDEHRRVFERLGAKVDTTAWQEEAMAARLRSFAPHVLFACLGTTRARKRGAEDPKNETYDAIDYGLTAMLVRGAAALERPPRFVYLSSAGVRANTGSSYLEARWKLESELVESGLEYSIGRPAIISGTDRGESRPLERAGAVLGDALLGAAAAIGFGGLRDKWASLTGSELAAALVNYGLSEDGRNKILDADELRARAGAS